MASLSDDAKEYYRGAFRVMQGGVPCRVFIKMKGDEAVRSKDYVPPAYTPWQEHVRPAAA